MTDNQALNLGMAMHLLFNSLSYGRDIVNKSMECHGYDNNNTVTINYSFIGGHLTINWVTVANVKDDDLTIALRRMVSTLEMGKTLPNPCSTSLDATVFTIVHSTLWRMTKRNGT